MQFLAINYNMTFHCYVTPLMTTRSRIYMLEINPNYANDFSQDESDSADARWIDTEKGVFINIVTLRPKESEKEVLQTKNNHFYEVSRSRRLCKACSC